MKPIISIITTTYNHEKYIGKCIDSVLRQSFSDWEMVIIDDGSTDGTSGICKSYADREPRIKYLRQDNIGLIRLAESYNKALEQCNGKYIAILEGDDYWGEAKLQQAYEKLSQNDVILYWARCSVVDQNENIYTTIPNQQLVNLKFYNNEEKGLGLGAVLNFFPAPLTWVILKSSLEEVGGFASYNDLPTTDLPTIMKLIFKGRFYYDDESHSFYRRHLSQATRQFGIDLAIKAKECILSEISSLSETDRAALPYSIAQVSGMLDDNILINYSMAGRKLLIDREKKLARSYFFKALTGSGNPLLLWRIKSFIGIIFSFVGLDMESMAKMLGKNTYK